MSWPHNVIDRSGAYVCKCTYLISNRLRNRNLPVQYKFTQVCMCRMWHVKSDSERHRRLRNISVQYCNYHRTLLISSFKINRRFIWNYPVFQHSSRNIFTQCGNEIEPATLKFNVDKFINHSSLIPTVKEYKV